MSFDLDDVLSRLVALVREHEAANADPGPGEGNFQCVDCRGCTACRFSVGCVRCEECTYCEGCHDCVSCTQTRFSRGCLECTHVEDSLDCVRCHYLMLCVDCEDCVQCFACVGLQGEEFCILNERYSRKQYFDIVNEVREHIARRRAAGWQPPWRELELRRASMVEERSADDASSRTSSVARGRRPAQSRSPIHDAEFEDTPTVPEALAPSTAPIIRDDRNASSLRSMGEQPVHPASAESSSFGVDTRTRGAEDAHAALDAGTALHAHALSESPEPLSNRQPARASLLAGRRPPRP